MLKIKSAAKLAAKALILQLALSATSLATTYYVSPTGKAENPGTTEAAPLDIVQTAVDKMAAGDTLIVLDGVYTGTLKLKPGITIKAQNPRKAIFSGAEQPTGTFTKHAENIYKLPLTSNPKQIFYKDTPMTWATWPNITWEENWIGTKKWVKAKSKPGEITSPLFNQLKGKNLIGAYAFMRYSKGNSCYSRPITAFAGNTLKWDDTNFYNGNFTGEDGRRGAPWLLADSKKGTSGYRFFLSGALDLLDSEGEWFAKDNTLYFYTTNGTPNPADFLIKTNDYSIHQPEPIADLTIQGIDLFATSVNLGNPANKNITLRDCHFTYIGSEPLFLDSVYGRAVEKSIRLSGTNILVDKCLFAGAQNAALKMSGANITVQDSVFAENNRHANFESRSLALAPTGTYKITRNTFFNICSDAISIQPKDDFTRTTNPEVSYNHICNAGIYNSDVSGVYFPHLTMNWTDFHHNWVHNVKGNGVRLDQAGEELTLHHNIFWASKRGLNIEGYGKFNVYNNTSVLNKESCAMTRNVIEKRKGSNPDMVSNDLTFSPITDWNILNNLVQEFTDRVGPSEKGAIDASKKKGILHPERAKKATLPIKDRGSIKGNITHFKMDIFKNGTLASLDLVPTSDTIKNGATATPEQIKQGVTSLDTFRGAYDPNPNTTPWTAGSTWMPYGLTVSKTVAQAEQFAKKYRSLSFTPKLDTSGLAKGLLSTNSHIAPEVAPSEKIDKKKDRKEKKKAKKKEQKSNKKNKQTN